jgi:hypothetical protein
LGGEGELIGEVFIFLNWFGVSIETHYNGGQNCVTSWCAWNSTSMEDKWEGLSRFAGQYHDSFM